MLMISSVSFFDNLNYFATDFQGNICWFFLDQTKNMEEPLQVLEMKGCMNLGDQITGI